MSPFPLASENVKKTRGPGDTNNDGTVQRKGSDSSTIVDGMPGASGGLIGRKNSLDTTSMAFDANEEMKESVALESMDDRRNNKDRKTTLNT